MIVFYTSGHGFGHASRDIEVMHALRRHAPNLRLLVRTAVPAWLFQTAARVAVDLQPLETDSGVAQIDSLTIDERETVRRAVRYYENFDERVAAEATLLKTIGASLVVADVPPLACAAAARAELPCVVLANFTWDWIYRGLETFERDAAAVLPIIERAYAAATYALRLPLHGGFEPMRKVVRDIPFVARRSTHGRTAVRAALGLDGSRPIVLGSFGGHGLRVPYQDAARDGRFILLLTDFEAESNTGAAALPNVRCLTTRQLADRQLHYDDLVAAADVVVSKPGYGIVSECVANNTALLYTSRGRMVEYDVFVEQMPRVLRCRYITQADLLAGRWSEHVEALLEQPAPPTTSMVNGADVAAQFLLKLVY